VDGPCSSQKDGSVCGVALIFILTLSTLLFRESSPDFYRFLNMVINDTTFLLDESLEKLKVFLSEIYFCINF